MKLRLLSTFFLLFAFTIVIAQNEYNEALVKLKSATTNEEKLDLYTIIFRHCAQNSIDSLDYYSNNALEEFKKDNYIAGISEINVNLAVTNNHIGKIKLAETQALAGLEAAKSINYLSVTGKAYSVLGVIHAKKGEYTEANRLVFKALSIFQNEAKVDTIKLISTYIKLGLINNKLNLWDNSMMYYNEGIFLSNKVNSSDNLAYIYTNIGVMFGKIQNLDSAQFYLNKSLEISEKNNDKYTKLLNYNNLGNIELQRANPKKAIEYYNKSLKIAEETNNQEETIRAKLNILEASNPPFKNSIDSLNKLLELVKNKELNYFVQEILYVKMDLNVANGNYKDAFEIQQEILTIDDSLRQLQDKQEIEEVKTIHEVEQAKAALHEMEELREREKDVKNTIIVFLILVFLAAVSLLFVLKRKNEIHKKLLQREIELQRLDDSKNRLFSILGHDLRGPIGNMMSLIELTKMKDCDERNHYLELLTTISSTVYETLNNILEWGKSQMKGESLSLESFNAFNETIVCLGLYSDALRRKKIDLRTTIDATIDLHFDLNHYHLIIRNLVSNAIKFSKESGSIEIGTTLSDNPEFITFYIKDNGIGIKPAKLKTIFEDNWESTDGTADEKGSGLGLLLCKTYVEECGGKIWVESKLYEGSTFYFSIKHS